MRQISSIVTPGSGIITAFVDGQSYTIPKDHPNYEQVKKSIREDDAVALKKFMDIPQGVLEFSGGSVTVQNGVVYHNGQELHHVLTSYILNLMREGFEFASMLKFLENLLKNTSRRAVQELYNFLSHQHLPITEDGCFLAYKRVRDNFMDIYSGKFDNNIGKVVSIPRNEVDDDYRNTCSHGLHVGAISYVRGYSGDGCQQGGKVLIVKVNPADVVSVPTTEDVKCRVCSYEVIGLYQGDLSGPLYTSNGLRSTPPPSSWSNEAASAVREALPEDEELLSDDDEDEECDDDEFDDNDFDEDEDDEPPYPQMMI